MEECDGSSVKEDIFFFPKSLKFLFVFILCAVGLFEYMAQPRNTLLFNPL